MITVSEAKDIIAGSLLPLEKTAVPLTRAAGLVLAEDCFARINVPPFDQSSMDGYAFRFADRKNSLKIAGVIPAGGEGNVKLPEGNAFRIFTGAPVPEGADTIVIQERVSSADGSVTIQDHDLDKGANIRPSGAEIRKNEIALSQGTLLSPAALGFLASVGIGEVEVFALPRVTIIVTGPELVKAGAPLRRGQVYESNSITLNAALQRSGITEIHTVSCGDDLDELICILKESLSDSDMVLLTGGISVGDYDFVLQATQACDVLPLFHKVRQRPGKPLFFGMHAAKPVFGLPGNPSSVLTCFYEYVLPAIGLMTGRKNLLKTEYTILTSPYEKKTGLTHFLKGKHNNDGVRILDGQESYKMSSFAVADCLVVLPENETSFQVNDIIQIHLIP